MQDFADSVIEACNTNVVGYSDSRFLQCLVHAGSSLVRADKKGRGSLPLARRTLLLSTKLAILRTNLAEARFKTSFLHGLAIAVGTASEPGKPPIADIPDVPVTLGDEIPGNLSGTSHIVRENAVILFGLPIADNIVSHHGEGNPLLRKSRENTDRVCTAQNDTARTIGPR